METIERFGRLERFFDAPPAPRLHPTRAQVGLDAPATEIAALIKARHAR